MLDSSKHPSFMCDALKDSLFVFQMKYWR